jgi:hypothetical protein
MARSNGPIQHGVPIAAGIILVVGSARAQNFDAGLQAGKAEYLSNCAKCHGADGRGAGPHSAALKKWPADLTLSKPGSHEPTVSELPGAAIVIVRYRPFSSTHPSNWRSLSAAPSKKEGVMDKFIVSQNITHYSNRLMTEKDPAKRETLQKFLTEEMVKQAANTNIKK